MTEEQQEQPTQEQQEKPGAQEVVEEKPAEEKPEVQEPQVEKQPQAQTNYKNQYKVESDIEIEVGFKHIGFHGEPEGGPPVSHGVRACEEGEKPDFIVSATFENPGWMLNNYITQLSLEATGFTHIVNMAKLSVNRLLFLLKDWSLRDELPIKRDQNTDGYLVVTNQQDIFGTRGVNISVVDALLMELFRKMPLPTPY